MSLHSFKTPSKKNRFFQFPFVKSKNDPIKQAHKAYWGKGTPSVWQEAIQRRSAQFGNPNFGYDAQQSPWPTKDRPPWDFTRLVNPYDGWLLLLSHTHNHDSRALFRIMSSLHILASFILSYIGIIAALADVHHWNTRSIYFTWSIISRIQHESRDSC